MKKRTGWLEYNAVVCYRQAVYEDGTVGTPQVTKKFITEPKEQKKDTKPKLKKGEREAPTTSKRDEEVEL